MKTIKAYHGTQHLFKAFNPSKRGTLGAGFYFTSDQSCARDFADENGVIYSVKLVLNNPLKIKADFEQGWEIDFDSPALPLINKLFDPNKASRLIKKSQFGDGMFGKEIIAAAKKQGYDGIVARHDDGGKEYVAFRRSQIEIIKIKKLMEYK